MKTIWVVGGGIESIPGLALAKKMGLVVVVSDADPEAPGIQIADFGYCASTYDFERTLYFAKLHLAQGNQIDGFISLAADVPKTVAGLSSYFGLPTQSLTTANLAADKFLMKERLKVAGVNIPKFAIVNSFSDIGKFQTENPGKSVLKPTDSRGSRGVLVIDGNSDLDWAYRESLSFSPSKTLIIEEFLSGPQFSTESVISRSHWLHLGFADRNYQNMEKLLPRIIENGGSQPSIHPQEVQERILHEVEKAGEALGLTSGILKGDMVWHNNMPYVIEVATRLSGGWFSSIQIPASTGISIIELAIRIALGEIVDIERNRVKKRKSVAIRYLFPLPNVNYRSLTNNLPRLGIGIIESRYLQESDYKNTAMKSHTDRLAFVIAKGRSVNVAIRRAERAIEKIYLAARIVERNE
jgi:biotin carboxylase